MKIKENENGAPYFAEREEKLAESKVKQKKKVEEKKVEEPKPEEAEKWKQLKLQ